MNSLRIGVVGAGQISALTASDFSRHPQAQVVAIADLDTSRAQQLAAQVGADQVFTNPTELFDCTEIDAVYVAVPNAFHEEIACGALASGKHVLLDKPFAVDLAGAQRIADCARTHNRTLMLGMNQRFERNVQRAKLLRESGRLGEVYHAKAFWRRRRGIPRLGSWFTSKSAAGGGALLDIGVHVLDVALHLLDNFRPLTVSGACYTRFGNRGQGEGSWGKSKREFDTFDVDDFATAFIRLEGGVVLTLEAAWALHQPAGNDHDVVLYGEDAAFAVHADTLFENGPDGEYHSVQSAATGDLPYTHCNRVSHFVNVLRGEEQPLVTIDQALTVQKIIDAIYQSAASAKEVQL